MALGGLTLTPAPQAGGVGLMAIVRGGFNQQGSGMAVAGIGDGAAPLGVGRGELAGDEARREHGLGAWMSAWALVLG
jgi:hypothetical protein